MPAIAAGAAIVGAGIQIYGDIKSANDQAQLDQDRAQIAQEQAQEVGAREAANETLRNQQATRQQLQFGSSFAASGRAGVGVGSQLQIQNQADTQNMISNREAQFQEKMLTQQAGIDTTLAQQSIEAGTINAIGAGIGGVGRAAGIATSGGSNPGYGGTQSMGSYPSPGGAPASAGAMGGG
jgi:multidrug efflux pump subunit AcrA (membrane-fusion protein)